MSKYDIVCIGMAIMDSIIRGFEPEPVSKTGYRAESGSLNVGGDAVNESIASAKLGMNTAILCSLGNDPAGEIIKEELEGYGVHTDLIVRSDIHPTPITTIFVKEDGNRRSITNSAHSYNFHPERHAERLAPACARALKACLVLLAPFSRLMVAGSRVFGNLLTRERRALSDDEMRTVVESAAASGELDREEASMVEGVMRLPDLYALNEMTPRVRLVGVEATLPDAEKIARAEASEYPYLPVYRGDMDHVEGFLDTERLLSDPARRVSDATERPLRVPEHEGLDDLLVTFMKTGRKIALVTDRWGGTAGVITRGDILELIVKPVVDDDEEDGR